MSREGYLILSFYWAPGSPALAGDNTQSGIGYQTGRMAPHSCLHSHSSDWKLWLFQQCFRALTKSFRFACGGTHMISHDIQANRIKMSCGL